MLSVPITVTCIQKRAEGFAGKGTLSQQILTLFVARGCVVSTPTNFAAYCGEGIGLVGIERLWFLASFPSFIDIHQSFESDYIFKQCYFHILYNNNTEIVSISSTSFHRQIPFLEAFHHAADVVAVPTRRKRNQPCCCFSPCSLWAWVIGEPVLLQIRERS